MGGMTGLLFFQTLSKLRQIDGCRSVMADLNCHFALQSGNKSLFFNDSDVEMRQTLA
jgi:hypothetical protein